jgi:hypothetical protein
MLCYYFTTFITEVQLYCYYKSRLHMLFHVYIRITRRICILYDLHSTQVRLYIGGSIFLYQKFTQR